MNPRSLRFRLTAWYAGILAAAFVVLGALLFVQVKDYLESTLLATQARRARQIGETLVAGIPRTGEGAMAAEVEELYAPELSDRFIRITRPDGRQLYVSGPPSDHSFDPSQVAAAKPNRKREFTRHFATDGGLTLLLAGFRSGPPTEGYLVEVGTPSDPIDTFLRHLALLLGLGLPVVILIAACAGYGLVGRALRPVDRLAGKAARITQHNLSERLPVVATGDELERLALSLNQMIGRLDDAFQNSQRFVADASHELRTPLTILHGELESLAAEPAIRADFSDRIDSLLEETERLARIVERLLTLSRLDAGEGRSEWERIDLGALAAGIAEQMTLLAVDKKILLRCEADGSGWVRGDAGRLKQVVVNLLDNAIKYTPTGGSVGVAVSSDAAWVSLEVRDTGSGISPAALPHIFERFYRADPARSRDPDGAGLGLAIVRAICIAHGGTIEAESAGGGGSCFRVRLPRAGGPQTPTVSS